MNRFGKILGMSIFILGIMLNILTAEEVEGYKWSLWYLWIPIIGLLVYQITIMEDTPKQRSKKRLKAKQRLAQRYAEERAKKKTATIRRLYGSHPGKMWTK